MLIENVSALVPFANMAVVLEREPPRLSKLNIEVDVSELVLVEYQLWLVQIPIEHELIHQTGLDPSNTRFHLCLLHDFVFADTFALLNLQYVLLILTSLNITHIFNLLRCQNIRMVLYYFLALLRILDLPIDVAINIFLSEGIFGDIEHIKDLQG